MESKFLRLLTLALILVGNMAFAQTLDISGVVYDESNQPLPGASVIVKGTSSGTSTDFDGNFRITGSEGQVIEVSFIGYITGKVTISKQTNYSITLQPDAAALDEVVVTGYGVTKKSSFAGAAQTVGADALETQQVSSFEKALEGAVAGLKVSNTSGQPGASSDVMIRGRGSFNSGTQPLYVIDGVPIVSETIGMRSGEGASISPLSSINPNDIETVTVLKDATATSIYGARAANGVIVITTKQGKNGDSKYTFTSKYGVSQVPQRRDSYRVVNRSQYMDIQTDGLVNAGYFPNKDEALQYMMANVVAPGDHDTDWYEEVTQQGVYAENNISVQGGNEKDKYFISLGMLKNEGVVIGTGQNRVSGRLNFDRQENKWVRFGLNANISVSEIRNGTRGGYFSDPVTQSWMQRPTDPVYGPDGKFNINTANGYNPVAQRSENGDVSVRKMLKSTISGYLNINLAEGLSYTGRAGIDYYDLAEDGLWSYYNPQGRDMGMFGEHGTTRRSLWTLTNTINYIKTVDDHNFNVMLGQEAQRAHQTGSYLSGQNYPSWTLITVENAAKPTSASTNFGDYSLASYFTRVQYDFASKYHLTGSYRLDGSSRFGANNRYAGFWSVGAKYSIHREDYMDSVSGWLTGLTLRSSYGTSGNQDIGWYQSRGLYGYGFDYNQNPGSAPTQFENPDLRWEQSAKFNVGLDINLFHRFNISAEYYNDLTTDMLFNVPVSYTTGMGSIMQNVGSMRNQGFEFLIDAGIITNRNFTWSASLNITHNINKIEKLSTDEPIEGTYTIRQVGHSFNSFYMREYAGVNPDNGRPTWYKEDGSVTENYNEANKRHLGSADPDFYGGLTNTFTFGNFDLSILMSFSYGGQVYNSALRYDEQVGSGGFGPTSKYVYDNAWQKPGDQTDVPQFIYGGNNGARNHSSRFLMDGSYLRLRNMSFGYNIPEMWTKKIGITNTRVFVNADNLYTFHNVRALDPETGPNGVIWWNYPVPRTITFGVNIGF